MIYCNLLIFSKDADVIAAKLLECVKVTGMKAFSGISRKTYENGEYTLMSYSTPYYYHEQFDPVRRAIDKVPHELIISDEYGSFERATFSRYEGSDEYCVGFDGTLQPYVAVKVSLDEDAPKRKKKNAPEIPVGQMKETLYNLYCNKMANDGEEPDKYDDFLTGRYLNPDSMFFLIDSTDHELPLGKDKEDDAWKLWLSYCSDTSIRPE